MLITFNVINMHFYFSVLNGEDVFLFMLHNRHVAPHRKANRIKRLRFLLQIKTQELLEQYHVALPEHQLKFCCHLSIQNKAKIVYTEYV